MRMANKLKELRQRAGIPMSVLARRSGVSRCTIYLIETGKQQNPQAGTMSRIAKALGLPVEVIFFDNDD
jgi:putative transcriptional regulator